MSAWFLDSELSTCSILTLSSGVTTRLSFVNMGVTKESNILWISLKLFSSDNSEWQRGCCECLLSEQQ